MMASVESADVSKEFCAALQAWNKPTRAKAVENWVPLMQASPSFGPSSTGSSSARSKAVHPGNLAPSNVASPSPIITAVMCDKGAKSPEAPTEPCAGITGTTPRANMPSSSSTKSHLTPDAPRPKDSSFKVIINRTTFSSTSSPTPQQWLRIRLR